MIKSARAKLFYHTSLDVNITSAAYAGMSAAVACIDGGAGMSNIAKSAHESTRFEKIQRKKIKYNKGKNRGQTWQDWLRRRVMRRKREKAFM